METMVRISPTRGHDRIGKVERQYMKEAYKELCQDSPAMLKDQRLLMTSRDLNVTPDSDKGIPATTLVYSVYEKLLGSSPRGTMKQQANKICSCVKIVMKLKAQRTVFGT